MRVALQIPSGARTAEVPTRRWTPGAGEAPQVSMVAVVDLFTKKPWNELFLDVFDIFDIFYIRRRVCISGGC